MRIEKINDRQIRCTLNQKDLQDREIGISELAYGTAKAKALFRDMMQQASYEFGFDADDIPLMIEAIPLLPEALVLIVTKIEEPDELDTRFSSFSEDDEWEDFEDDFDYDEYNSYPGEDGVLLDSRPEETSTLWSFSDTLPDDAPNSNGYEEDDFISLPEVLGMEPHPRQAQPAAETAPVHDAVFIFSFVNLDTISRAAKMVNPVYHGENILYKDSVEGRFYLLLHRKGHSQEEFSKICNLLQEYGSAVKKSPSTVAYLEEHYLIFIAKNALSRLANL